MCKMTARIVKLCLLILVTLQLCVCDRLCRVGDNPEASVFFPFARRGHFLNIQFPAECDGVVTAWNYCYYPDGIRFEDRNYTATVALWRPNSTTSDLYNIVEDSVTELQIQPVQTEVNFNCTQESLAAEKSIEIRRGDVTGVFLPGHLSIPMIGSHGNYSIYRDRAFQSDPSSVLSLSQDLFVRDRGIHLYADITSEGITITDDITINDGTTVSEFNSSLKDTELTVIGVATGVPLFILTALAIGSVLVVLVARKIGSRLRDVDQIETTTNQVYGLWNEKMKMTTNEVYGLGASEEIEMPSYPRYKAFQTEQASQRSEQVQENLYEVVDEKTDPDFLYDYVSNVN